MTAKAYARQSPTHHRVHRERPSAAEPLRPLDQQRHEEHQSCRRGRGHEEHREWQRRPERQGSPSLHRGLPGQRVR